MDEIREKISIERYIYCVVAVIMLVCGLTYLLSSCTEIIDGPAGKKGKGVKVPVSFSVHLGSHGDEEAVEARSLNAKNEPPATDIVRVTNNVYMYATIEEERPVTTRAATTNLPDGTLVRIAAYNLSTAGFIDTATYISSNSGDLLPLYDGLFVPDNINSYRFVAYSMNTYTMPNQNATTLTFTPYMNYPDLDLLWGHTDTTVIQPIGTESIDITLNHLYSRIKVEATTEAILPAVNFNRIGSAYLNPHYDDILNLNLFTGVLTPLNNNPVQNTMQLTKWRNQGDALWGTGTGLSSQNIESDYVYIFTNASNLNSLMLNNLMVDGVELGNRQFRVTKQLLPGHSYILKLTFKRLVWAGSNIFWNGTKLTFFPETAPEVSQGYQGVYFMWGSLIGISPRSVSDPPNFVFSPSSTKLYVPLAGSWNVQYAAGSHPLWTGTAMTDIPHKTGEFLTNASWLDNHTTQNYLVESHDPAGLTGDICKYLTERGDAPEGEWRMPNSSEFGAASAEYSMNINPTSFEAIKGSVNEDGTTDLYALPSYVRKTISKTIFPAAGQRDQNGIATSAVFYLSGSPTVSTNPFVSQVFDRFYVMDIGSTVTFNSKVPLGSQGPVRCVKIEGSAIFLDLDFPTADVEDWEAGGTFGQGDTDGQGNLWY